MGNQLSYGVGSVVSSCGCTSGVTKVVIHIGGIEPWSSKMQVKPRLERQAEMSRLSPLRHIHVQDVLNHFHGKVKNWTGGLSAHVFLKTAQGLLQARGIRCSDEERKGLLDVFESMDFDGDGFLSLGEFAGCMTVFFYGTRNDRLKAVFETINSDNNGVLSRNELRHYLQPFVQAMTPDDAASLRPLLLEKTTDDVFSEMASLSDDGSVSLKEMVHWMEIGHNIIDRLAAIIDCEVYRMWMDQQQLKYPTWLNSNASKCPAACNTVGARPLGHAHARPCYI